MNLLLGSALSLDLACSPPKKVTARPQFRYVLASKPTSQANCSDVSLRDNRTGRVLWKHRVADYDQIGVDWAKDHRALLISYPHDGLLVWRVGQPLLEIPNGNDTRPGGMGIYDYPMDAKWSPDARRLLVSFGISGMSEAGYSQLFCLTFPGKRYKYTVLPAHCYVRDMGWRSNRVAFYCPDAGEGKTGKPRLWRVPR